MDTEVGRRILQAGFDVFQIGGAAKAKETFRYNTYVPECLLFLYHTISF